MTRAEFNSIVTDLGEENIRFLEFDNGKRAYFGVSGIAPFKVSEVFISGTDVFKLKINGNGIIDPSLNADIENTFFEYHNLEYLQIVAGYKTFVDPEQGNYSFYNIYRA